VAQQNTAVVANHPDIIAIATIYADSPINVYPTRLFPTLDGGDGHDESEAEQTGLSVGTPPCQALPQDLISPGQSYDNTRFGQKKQRPRRGVKAKHPALRKIRS
jgi:hypothetical protein